MTKAGEQIIQGAKEALAIARGEAKAPRMHVPVDVNGTTFRLRLELDTNDTYLVTTPDLPEVTTFGETEADAIEQARKAIQEALAA